MASSDSPELVPDILIAAWLIIAMECNYNVATVTSDRAAIWGVAKTRSRSRRRSRSYYLKPGAGAGVAT